MKLLSLSCYCLSISLCFMLFSCSNTTTTSKADETGNTRDMALAAPAASTDSTAVSPVAAPINSPDRKMIKTADLRCRVNDVFKATTHVEAIVKAAGGIVSDSRMDNTSNDIKTLPYTHDSVRQVQSYTTTAHLTLRVPVQHLDSILADVANGAAFINGRHLILQDVTLQYLSNDLKNKAITEKDASARAVNLAKKTHEAIRASEYADQRQEHVIDRNIENLTLLDNARYATLQLDLYQPDRLDVVVLADASKQMKPSIGQQMRSALADGWGMLQDFTVLLMRVWPLILLLLALLVFVRLRRKGLPALSAR